MTDSSQTMHQTVLGDSASSDEIEAFEELFDEIHPLFRVPHRPERQPAGEVIDR